MIISSYALGCTHTYIYIRGEMMREYVVLAEGRRRGLRSAATSARTSLGTGFELRPHRAPRRRRVHLRRGDRAAQLARGQARPAAAQAAVPGGQGPVRQADDRQQRRDADERAAHHRQGRRSGSPSSASARSGGTRIVCVSGHVNKPGVLRAADGHHVPRDDRRGLRRRARSGTQGQGGHPRRRRRCRRSTPASSTCRASSTRSDRRAHQAGRGHARACKFDLGGGRTLRTMAGSGGVVVMDDDDRHRRGAARAS